MQSATRIVRLWSFSVCLVVLLAVSGIAQVTAPMANVTGTWQALDQAYSPWIFNLQASGGMLTGRVWQQGCITDPSEIINGRIEGANVTFSYRTFSRASRAAQFFPALVRLFGSQISEKFTVKRATAAVTGRITIEAPSIPRPLFQFGFVTASGKRYEPVRRQVWTTDPPRTTGMQATQLLTGLGSPFDAVPHFETSLLPGNPDRFIAWLPEGEYHPVVTGLPDGYVLKSMRSGSRDITASNFQVTNGAVTPDLTVTLGVDSGPAWGRVAGKILNATTRVYEGSSGGFGGPRGATPPTAVVLINRAFSEFWIAPIRPDGSFEFSRILPGDYEVRMFPDTPLTAAMNLAVPTSANLDVQWTAPNVTVVPCPNC